MKNFFHEFKEFAIKGNVMDLAVGVIIGSAFGKIVDSLVNDIIMPALGFLINRVDFNKYIIGPVRIGVFTNNIVNFFIVALVIFFIVKQLNRLRRRGEKEEDKKLEQKIEE